MRKILILFSLLIFKSLLFSQEKKAFTTDYDTIHYQQIISNYIGKSSVYNSADSTFRQSLKYLTNFTTKDSVVLTLMHAKQYISSNIAAIEINKLYAFRNTVDSLNKIREKVMADYWNRQQLIAIADTAAFSTEDTLFVQMLDALAYQDTINLDSLLNELNPFNTQLLLAIDHTITNFKNDIWINWIKTVRRDTTNFYLVDIYGDSMLIRLYDKNPELIKFGITDYWGSKIPAVIRNINKNSFRVLIDDAPAIDYATDEKAKQAINSMDTVTNELKLTLKTIPLIIPKPRWIYGGNTNLDLSQIGMYQWAQGGDPAISVVAGLVLFGLYKKDNLNWDNRARFRYGKIRQGRYQDSLVRFRSLEDKMEFSTKFGYRAFGQFFVSFSGDFRTQFGNIYQWNGNVQGDKISDFMAPAYLTFSLGLDYKPDKQTTLFVAPISAKNTFVLDPSSEIKSRYGVDTTMNRKSEMGMRFKGLHKFKVWDNIEIRNELELFSNYITKPQNIDIDWEVVIIFPVNDYIRATLGANVVYDDDIDVPKYKTENGVEVRNDGPGLQFREMITIGFSIKF